MIARPLFALVRKDLQVVFSDRYALILSFAAPIALASFMAVIFGGAGATTPSRIPIRVVDEDDSPVSRAILDNARSEKSLDAIAVSRADAMASVRKGEAVAAVMIPEGFGAAASEAIFGDEPPPELTLLQDPTRQSDLSLVRGLLARLILEAVSSTSKIGEDPILSLLGELDSEAGPEPSSADDAVHRAEFLSLFDQATVEETSVADRPVESGETESLLEAFPGLRDWFEPGATEPEELPLDLGFAGKSGKLTLPYTSRDLSITSGGGEGERQALAAHAFAGMVVQFVLFSAVEWGVALMNERQKGLWKRLRSAPVSQTTLLLSKAVGCSIMSLLITLTVFGFGAAVFGFRIQGDALGFAAVAVAYAMTAATFGLLIASIGRTPQGARSVSILAVLVMVLLGGGWIPSFLFPSWLQQATPAIPTRWAIDGFDGVIARGFTLTETVPTILVLIGFSAAFGGAALVGQRRAETCG